MTNGAAPSTCLTSILAASAAGGASSETTMARTWRTAKTGPRKNAAQYHCPCRNKAIPRSPAVDKRCSHHPPTGCGFFRFASGWSRAAPERRRAAPSLSRRGLDPLAERAHHAGCRTQLRRRRLDEPSACQVRERAPAGMQSGRAITVEPLDQRADATGRLTWENYEVSVNGRIYRRPL
jgi:hypothetical protein